MTTFRLRNIPPSEITSPGLQAAGATGTPLPGITPDALQHFLEHLSAHPRTSRRDKKALRYPSMALPLLKLFPAYRRSICDWRSLSFRPNPRDHTRFGSALYSPYFSYRKGLYICWVAYSGDDHNVKR